MTIYCDKCKVNTATHQTLSIKFGGCFERNKTFDLCIKCDEELTEELRKTWDKWFYKYFPKAAEPIHWPDDDDTYTNNERQLDCRIDGFYEPLAAAA